MIERVYKCDLCQNTYKNDDLDKKLIGFKFTANGNRWLIAEHAHVSERHLCIDCINGIRNHLPK